MPAFGGTAPFPRRFGGGIKGLASGKNRIQLVFESISAARGSAYDQTQNTAVGVENLAMARAVALDGYGANERLANELYPPTSTVAGLLPRWETILGQPPLKGDSQRKRQARVGLAWARVGAQNIEAEVISELTAILGPLFVGLTHQAPATATVVWPAGQQVAGFPWYSTIALLNVQLTIPTGYANPDSSPNAAWWDALGPARQALDSMLPAWMTFQFYILSQIRNPGHVGFFLDEPNLDLEILRV